MGVFFPKPYPVIQRGGFYVDGVWVPSNLTSMGFVALNIQPASQSDYNRMQATPSGRRISAMLRAFGDVETKLNVAGENGNPGDLIRYKDQNWLVVGSTEWNVFDNSETAHMRYLLVLEAEHAAGEVMV